VTTHPIRILVIDDEPAIRRLLKTSLSAEGYEVEEAATGEAGWAQFNKVKPDLVLLDLGLPDIDGREVLKRVRGLGAPTGGLVPVIVLSIRSDERGKVEALDLGADDWRSRSAWTSSMHASAPRCATGCSRKAPSRSSKAAISPSISCAATSR
jgi:two-component system KDP operon response regulator KdpE